MTPTETDALIAEAREWSAELVHKLADALEQAQAKVRAQDRRDLELQDLLERRGRECVRSADRIAELERELAEVRGTLPMVPVAGPEAPAPTPTVETCGTCGKPQASTLVSATGYCSCLEHINAVRVSQGKEPVPDCSPPATPRPGPLSQAAQDARKPPPPEALVDALQNRVHKDTGKLISATPIQTATPPREDEWEAKAVAFLAYTRRLDMPDYPPIYAEEFRRIDAAAKLRGLVMGIRESAGRVTNGDDRRWLEAYADRLEREQTKGGG